MAHWPLLYLERSLKSISIYYREIFFTNIKLERLISLASSFLYIIYGKYIDKYLFWMKKTSITWNVIYIIHITRIHTNVDEMNKWTELSRVRLRVFSAVFPVADKMERGLRRDKVKYAWECNLTVREPAEETEYKRILQAGSGGFFCDNSVIIEMKYQRGYCAEFNEGHRFIWREKEPGNTTRNQKDCSRAERQLLFMEMLTAIAVVAMKTNDAE